MIFFFFHFHSINVSSPPICFFVFLDSFLLAFLFLPSLKMLYSGTNVFVFWTDFVRNVSAYSRRLTYLCNIYITVITQHFEEFNSQAWTDRSRGWPTCFEECSSSYRFSKSGRYPVQYSRARKHLFVIKLNDSVILRVEVRALLAATAIKPYWAGRA